jgi:PPK2 family polyphosphate:nucleotide phosphotransferase
VLLIFQAIDAAGKDGTIKHVMSGVNPQGCQVFSFKSPSAEDLDHDYLWRCMKCLPNRGHIGIFNRSYYEETLVVRLHPEFLARQKVPPELITKKIWEHRFEDIRSFEQYLSNNGVVVRKFFLHLSNEEQQKRFLERIETSDKNWKFSASDAAEREHWDKYMEAYEDMIRNTATEKSPWYVVPADNKWFTRVVVAAAVVETLASLDLKYPEVGKDKLKELAATKAALLKKWVREVLSQEKFSLNTADKNNGNLQEQTQDKKEGLYWLSDKIIRMAYITQRADKRGPLNDDQERESLCR